MHQGTVHRAGISGVWACRQINSAAAFTQTEKNDLLYAVNNFQPHRGISIRVPWKELEPTQGNFNDAVFDTARALADSALGGVGVELAIRPMAGEWAPAWVYALPGMRTWTNTNGRLVPHPCLTDGTPNVQFLDALEPLLEHLAVWCEQNGVLLLHWTWYGNKWDEPFGNAPLTYPTAGYDAAGNNWRGAMYALTQRLHTAHLAHPSLTFELPSSGTYNETPGGISGALASAATLWGYNSPYWYISENGIPTYHGLGNSNTSRHAQMVLPGNFPATGAESWQEVTNDFLIADNIDCFEIYVNTYQGTKSYTGTGASGIQTYVIDQWVASLQDPGVPPSPPTVTDFTPTHGPVSTPLTITGTNLTGATAVTMGGVPLTGYVVVNATTITATVPSGASGGVIAVVTPNGSASSSTSFTVDTEAMLTFGSRFRMISA